MSVPHSSPPTPRRGPEDLARELGLIAAGGACGALARAASAAALAAAGATGAWATQVVNLTGAFALGLLLTHLERCGPRPRLRPFLAVGLLGSFTTFSTLVADGRDLAVPGPIPLAASSFFLAASIALGFAAFTIAGRLYARLAASTASRPGDAP